MQTTERIDQHANTMPWHLPPSTQKGDGKPNQRKKDQVVTVTYPVVCIMPGVQIFNMQKKIYTWK